MFPLSALFDSRSFPDFLPFAICFGAIRTDGLLI